MPVTVDEMLFLTRTVARAARTGRSSSATCRSARTRSPTRTPSRNAIRFVKEGGADVVKLEGAGPMVSRVARDRRGRHPGDGPRRPDAAVGDDARRLQDPGQDGRGGARSWSPTRSRSRTAGCLLDRARGGSRRRSRRGSRAELPIPTIGIGAGLDCDGQVLVYHDLLGLTEGHLPALRQALREPLARDPRRARGLRGEVRSGAVPGRAAHLRDAGRRSSPRVRGSKPLDRAVRPRER